jgi:hypothetical protein
MLTRYSTFRQARQSAFKTKGHVHNLFGPRIVGANVAFCLLSTRSPARSATLLLADAATASTPNTQKPASLRGNAVSGRGSALHRSQNFLHIAAKFAQHHHEDLVLVITEILHD